MTNLSAAPFKTDGRTIDYTIMFDAKKEVDRRCTNHWYLGFEYDFDFIVTEYTAEGKAKNWKGDYETSAYNSRTIKNLKPNTHYRFYVITHRSYWNGSSGAVSVDFHFTTPSYNCYTPKNFKLDYRNRSIGQVSWGLVSGAESYDVGFGGRSDNLVPKITIYNFKETRASTKFLQSGYRYFVGVKSRCKNGTLSAWSQLIIIPAETYGIDKSGESPASNSQKSIVYPNTNQGNFKIKFGDEGKLIESVTIHDMFGNQVLHKEYNTELTEAEYNLGNKLKSGIYKIQIHTQNGIEYKTLLVEH